jgi:hypothetical protein
MLRHVRLILICLALVAPAQLCFAATLMPHSPLIGACTETTIVPICIPNPDEFRMSKPVQEAKQGCCSHHGGVCGCAVTGRAQCCDGAESPSCGCE